MNASFALVVALLQLGPHAPVVDPASMVMFPAGTQLMGTADDLMVGRYGDGWYVNQTPAHEVELGDFGLDVHEVSVGAFTRFLNAACGPQCFDPRMPIEAGDDGYAAHADYVDHPIAWVNWQSAEWYCRWAGKRLPREAEWTRAYVGAEGRAWPWAAEHGPKCVQNTFSYEGGRCAVAPRGRGTQAAGASVEGVHDLVGNVAEWTADPYGPHPGGPTLGLAEATGHRVVRGGSFLTPRQPQRSQARRGYSPSTRAPDLGFRCAWDPTVVDPPGVVRGELPAVPTVAAPSMSVTPPMPAGETAAEGLEGPGAVAVLDGVAYVGGRDGVYVWQDGVVSTLDLVGVEGWVSDGASMYGIAPMDDALWRIDLDAPVSAEMTVELPGVVTVVRRDGGWLWTDGQGVFVTDDAGEVEELVGGRVGVNGLVALPEGVAFSEVGPASTTLLFVGPDGTVRQLFDQARPLQLWGLNAALDGTLWTFLGLDQWPYSSLLCQLSVERGRFGCVTHTAPKASDLTLTATGPVWRGQYGVYALEDAQPYVHLGSPLAPTGMALSADSVWVTESATGRLIRFPR